MDIESIIKKAKNGTNLIVDHDIDGYIINIDGDIHFVPWSSEARQQVDSIREASEESVQSEYADDLIFGKDKREGVVSLEIDNNEIILYYNDKTVEKLPMVYWILAPFKIDEHYKKLEGNLHYKYIRTFKTFNGFKKYANYYRKKDVDVFRIWNAKEQAMIYHGITMFKGLKVKDVSVLSFDIESNGLVKDDTSKVFLITNTFRDTDGEVVKKHFRLDHYESDCEMIEDWCKWVVEVDPSVITGHNIFGYDCPYLQHCYADRDGHRRTLPIGKFGHEMSVDNYIAKFRVDGSNAWDYQKIQIPGRHVVDGMFLSVKYDIGRNFPSWGLKPIAQHLGIINEDRQFYDASQIGKNWHIPEEREKIVAYGIDDSDDSLALYDIMIPSMFYMCQYIPKPFQIIGTSASGAQLNSVLVRAYMQENHSIPKADESLKVYGGISFGIPGIHKNVFKVDVLSEYPSIIRAFNVYPITKDPKKYYLKMVNYFTERRFEQKNKYKETGDSYYDDLQASSKIFINSSFGLGGTGGLNFNDYKMADFITAMGRQIIKDTIKWATGKPLSCWWKDYEDEKDKLYEGGLRRYESYTEFVKVNKIYD